ncbi:PfkB family carbohydrate kinase [Rheinheimera nanhaiensis]|uniref:Fructokinase n=1 Tax=Rheinheimera nanhaiensis E407-8 TaxID=562729 RepID=I1DYK0_9GAMM|nr:PfkB family carbohydrate kinase [Rheinheimera nanhaiensis]GAB59128.1 fructokinase [Rheinheimera nanhaiensis E407-8]
MLAVIGENVVDLLPEPNGLYRPCLGGSPLNVAIGAARQQIKVSYISPLSQDAFGTAFADYLAKNAVIYGLDYLSSKPTSLAMVSIDAHQQPQYSLYRTGIADRDISAKTQIAALPADCKLLHLGSLALESDDAPRIRQVVAAAKAKGIQIALDINIRLNAVTNVAAYRAFVLEMLSHSDYIKASDEDLALLYGHIPVTEAAAAIRQAAPAAMLALTKGEHGATLFWQQHNLQRPVIKASRFIDTVGAGDTFWANLLAALLQLGLPDAQHVSADTLMACLTRAMLAASLNIACKGCNPPTADELKQALAQLD